MRAMAVWTGTDLAQNTMQPVGPYLKRRSDMKKFLIVAGFAMFGALALSVGCQKRETTTTETTTTRDTASTTGTPTTSTTTTTSTMEQPTPAATPSTTP
jgi:hypothetical protein